MSKKKRFEPEKRLMHIAAVVLGVAVVAATISSLANPERETRYISGECVGKTTNYMALRTLDGNEWELDTAAYAVSKGDAVVVEFNTLGTATINDDIVVDVRRAV